MMYNSGTYTTRLRALIKLILIITATLVLSACGGGGSGSALSVVNQSFSVDKGGTLTQSAPGVLASSSDPSGLSAILVSDPIHGLLTLNSDGSFSYTHNGSSSPSDSFTYKATDGSSESNIATVTINTAPVITGACLSTENLPGNLNNFVTDDNTPLTFTALTQPLEGTLDLLTDGTINYTLNNGNEDFKGIDSFTFEVENSIGGKATGTASIIAGKTRIMPLGDSITAGVGPTGLGCSANPREVIPDPEKIGYRAKLYSDLVSNRYVVDFVGGLSFGSSATPPIGDPDHEGQGGFTALQVSNNLTTWLNANPTDIVLLHIGTNDINSDDPNQTIAVIGSILDTVDTWEATNNPVTVLLSTIIERSNQVICDPNPTYDNLNVSALNNLITNLVASRSSDNLVLVDQHGAIVPATHISEDGVHPNPTGYERMADEWLSVLMDTSKNIDILRCPTSN